MNVNVRFGAVFSTLECRKTKTKVTTLTNHNSCKQPNVSTCSRRQARENACRQVTIGFGFTSDWLRKGREIF